MTIAIGALSAAAGCGSESTSAVHASSHSAVTPDSGPVDARSTTSPSWTAGPRLPEAVSEIGVAVLDGQVHVLGGYVQGRAHSRTHLVFDVRHRSWRRAAPLPVPLDHVGAAAVGSGKSGRVLVIGGYGAAGRPTSATYSYDPARDRWQVRAPLPRARAAAVTVVAGGAVHVIGGRGSEGDTGEHDVYDPSTDRWTTATPMPTPRDHAAAALVGSTIYVAAGRPGSKTLLEAYDLGSDRWRSGLPPLRQGRSSLAGVAWRGRFVVLGGEDAGERTAFRAADEYDPTARAWRKLPSLPEARQGIGAVVVDGAVLVPGGGPQAGGGSQSDQLLVLA